MIRAKKPEGARPEEPTLMKNAEPSNVKVEEVPTPSLGPQKPSQDPIYGM